MAKLKRVVRAEDPKEDMYHCCRWCHWYKEGKCYCSNHSSEESLDVYKVSEDGYLSQTLEETLNNEKLIKGFMFDVESLLDKWGISQKRKKEFEEHFIKSWENFADTSLKEVLDENVSVLYQTKMGECLNTSGVYVNEDFCCKYFE